MIRESRPTSGPGKDNGVTTNRSAAVLRLEAYGRYAHVLAAQLEALEAREPDLPRFHSLAREREEIAKEIDGTPVPEPRSPDLTGLLAEIRERVLECQRTDRAVLRRISELRAEAGEALEALEGRRSVRKEYTREPAARKGRQFDVKF